MGNKQGLEMLMEWWDFDIPLKNLFDFMEQDALWYMLQNEGRFKINYNSTAFVFEGQFVSRSTGVPQLFFVHMANYVEQKAQYVNVMLEQLRKQTKAHDRDFKIKMRSIIKKRYLMLDTLGLCEYAEVTRNKTLGIHLRAPNDYPDTLTGKLDDEWHQQEASTIIPFHERSKHYPPLGRVYNGYTISFVGFRALFMW